MSGKKIKNNQSTTYNICEGDPSLPDVAELLKDSESHANSLYPTEGVHMLPIDKLNDSKVHFFVARNSEGMVHGCGAIVLGENNSAEIKRMFVEPVARGKGLGAMILKKLEQEARNAGVKVIQLETGPLQPEAIRLYLRFGYKERGAFGSYKTDPYSIFMEKYLNE